LLAGGIASVLVAGLVGVGGIGLLLAGLVFQVCLGGLSALWVRFRYPGSLAALGVGSRRPARDLVVGAVSGLLLFFVVAFGVAPALQAVVRALLGHEAGFNQLPIPLTPSVIVGAAVLAVIIAPVTEEIFFRGFLYGSLRTRYGTVSAAGISAVAFGLFHASAGWILGPFLFIVGLGLAFLYEWRRSLVATIGAHAAFNIIGFSLLVMSRT
jgi:membrane protease YdiL (CAAX protease family)